MKAYWKYTVVPYLKDREDRFWLWLARHIPRKLRYWATIVSGTEATTGEWSNEEVPAVKFVEVLERIQR